MSDPYFQTLFADRIGGVNYTIKDGIVFDAKELLSDVEKMVRSAKDL